MSFTEFVANNGEAKSPPGAFQHSQQSLPTFKEPTEAQTAEVAAKAKEIATEIAQKFDGEYQGLTQRMIGDQTQLNQIYAAGMAPPLALFQAVAYQMIHLSNVCKSYQADADALAKAGSTEFQAYLKMFVDDAAAALVSIQNTPTAFMYGPPLDPSTFYAGMNHSPSAAPMPPQTWPGMGSPFGNPGTQPMGNPGPMSSADLGIFNDANNRIRDVTSRISSMWNDFAKS
jgi:hypothetical protein